MDSDPTQPTHVIETFEGEELPPGPLEESHVGKPAVGKKHITAKSDLVNTTGLAFLSAFMQTESFQKSLEKALSKKGKAWHAPVKTKAKKGKAKKAKKGGKK